MIQKVFKFSKNYLEMGQKVKLGETKYKYTWINFKHLPKLYSFEMERIETESGH